MKKQLITLSLLVLFTIFIAAFSTADEDIMITVAPNTLNIQSQGTLVTVHTNIAYTDVVGATVTLNGIGIDWWKSDNQGNFVAKFLMTDVKEIVDEGGLIILTLTGTTVDGVEFSGTDTITVVNNVPAGK